MHDMAVALDRHEFRDLDGAVFRNPADVVPGQVNKHQMLSSFLRIGQQFFGQTPIFFACATSLPGPGDGTNLDVPSPKANVDFRRTADQSKPLSKPQAEHMGEGLMNRSAR